MARPSKKTVTTENEEEKKVVETEKATEEAPETPQNNENEEEKKVVETEKATEEAPENIIALMKLYPQYEEFYVTPRGFVHPVGAPKYLVEGATLYKNKFFNK